MNDLPGADPDDEGSWDRYKVIPFEIRFRYTDKQIKNLDQIILDNESSGVLNWFLEGHREWKAAGALIHPDEVTDAVKAWRTEEDFLQLFLDEYTEKTENKLLMVLKSDLFSRFSEYADKMKTGRGVSNKEFSSMMRKKGYTEKDIRQGATKSLCWLNLKVKDRNSSVGMNEVWNDVTKDGL
jgi:putative DNA primase/helicase